MSASSSHLHACPPARGRYGLASSMLAVDVHSSRLLAHTVNRVRGAAGQPAAGSTQAVRAGDVNAMGIIHEVLHAMVGLYRASVDPRALAGALDHLQQSLGPADLGAALGAYLEQFPLAAAPDQPALEGQPGRERVLEELLLLRLANDNPGFAPLVELFDDERLEAETAYPRIIEELGGFFRRMPGFGPDGQDLLSLLESPMRASPLSLAGQLEFIRARWGHLLGDLLQRLLTGMDILREEEKMRAGAFAPGPPPVPSFAGDAAEHEAFSPDLDWMPRTVMMAKNTLVWLDQLSRAHGRAISTLDQVPDDELDRLAGAGFTSLWLIGVWERSPASRDIKRRMGNPEAEASAYSLADYAIAAELGGDAALENLKARAWARGIRLASDMVPNHTGIDSRWMVEHPERFLLYSHDAPPFPSYTFNGPNLSGASEVGVFLEDHYWDRTDAAVVFKRVDFRSGEVRYIYHGNDGTHMPWNDTAQLDFLRPDTREAVIQAILRVARQFPVIRFDAAMTLTKKHFQRLWYPEPGSGGDIPSRAGAGLTRHHFDLAMPREFWREVVDRIGREVPDTLLLAEAFWLLEGFFVRTLGMHRVYNSAFMHMLKAEDNAGYRQVMKNTLEFDPEVLKRYVNFMSNPDEETAIGQFGDGDKYFGVCTLLATLPGLPMFAHGQLEGFREKYGMEFRRAYWDEAPREDLLARAGHDIFPLLRRRWLFAEVEGFLLYDLEMPGGGVNEDVFAYSNSRAGQRGLVLYNNRYAEARGTIRMSAAYAVKTAGGKSLARRSLAEGLGVPADPSVFVVFREHLSGLEFTRNAAELAEAGLAVSLGAYQCQVFLDFRQVRDATGSWALLCAELAGRGVPSVEDAHREIELRPVHGPVRALLGTDTWQRFLRAARPECLADDEKSFVSRSLDTWRSLREGAGGGGTPLIAECLALVRASGPGAARPTWLDKDTAAALDSGFSAQPAALPLLWAWAVLAPFADLVEGWRLEPLLREFFARTVPADTAPAGAHAILVEDGPSCLRFLLGQAGWISGRLTAAGLAAAPTFPAAVHVHEHGGTTWLRREPLEALLPPLLAVGIVGMTAGARVTRKEARAASAWAVKELETLRSAAEAAGYRWDGLVGTPPTA